MIIKSRINRFLLTIWMLGCASIFLFPPWSVSYASGVAGSAKVIETESMGWRFAFGNALYCFYEDGSEHCFGMSIDFGRLCVVLLFWTFLIGSVIAMLYKGKVQTSDDIT